MPTISFDVRFHTDRKSMPTHTGYSIQLIGDVSDPTEEEKRLVMSGLARELIRINRKPSAASDRVPVNVEPAYTHELLSNHYTVKVDRGDGRPLGPTELNLALAQHAIARWEEERNREHKVVMPLSSLRRIAEAPETAREALLSVIERLSHAQEPFTIDDEGMAADLVLRGLVLPSEEPGLYELQNIDLK